MAIQRLDTIARQEQIAKATLDLVAAGGLKKLSVAAVARRVGLVPSALYRHFHDKDAVLDAALDMIGDKLMSNVAAARKETDSPVDQLHVLMMRHVGLIRENRGIPQVIFSQDFYEGNPSRREQVYHTIRIYLAEIAAIIRQGQQAREIDSGVNADAASVLFLGLIQPAAVLWHLSDGEFDVTRQAQQAWPLFRKSVIDGSASSTKSTKTKQRQGGIK